MQEIASWCSYECGLLPIYSYYIIGNSESISDVSDGNYFLEVIGLSWVTSFSEGARIQVRVQPRASRNEITGIRGDCLRIKLTAPPVDGEANKRLTKFLGQVLRCGSGRIKIARGATGRCKLLEITGVTEDEVRRLVGDCCQKRV
ncbi:MAG: DUF167 domain-containing protein [Syntrophaceticus schinkii]